MALESLQRDTQDFPIPFHLLDKEFTMPELHAVFETIHDKKLDRSRFQKKMFGYGVFERLHVLNKTVPYRKPYVYHFKKQILNG
ncbi:MAG: NUDIX hydrolase, partial [Bacteroidota bacterium]